MELVLQGKDSGMTLAVMPDSLGEIAGRLQVLYTFQLASLVMELAL